MLILAPLCEKWESMSLPWFISIRYCSAKWDSPSASLLMDGVMGKCWVASALDNGSTGKSPSVKLWKQEWEEEVGFYRGCTYSI